MATGGVSFFTGEMSRVDVALDARGDALDARGDASRTERDTSRTLPDTSLAEHSNLITHPSIFNRI